MAIVQPLALQREAVPHRGGDDDRGAVLVVVKDRNVHPLAQLGLDREAFRGLDVFEVDRAESRFQRGDDIAEMLRIGGVDLDVEHVDIGEFLEQDGFALHHRLAGERADIAKAENGGTVGDDGDQVATRGQVVSDGRIGDDRLAGGGNPGRVGERQIVLRRHALGRQDREFSRFRKPVIVKRGLPQVLVHGHLSPDVVRVAVTRPGDNRDRSLAAQWDARDRLCGREDSNFHGVSPTSTSSLRVYHSATTAT